VRVSRGAIGAVLTVGLALLPGPWGGTPLPPPGPVVPGVQGEVLRGAALARSFDCVRCHTEARTELGVNVPPSLRDSGSRSRAEWIAQYLVKPHDLRYVAAGRRPRMRMPPSGLQVAEARDLAAYLSTLRDTVLVPVVPGAEAWASDTTLVTTGRRLFAEYQCQGCHRMEGNGNRIGPELDHVGARRQPGYLFALLMDPQHVIPGTAMENKHLWEEEAQALTAFLGTCRGETPQGDPSDSSSY